MDLGLRRRVVIVTGAARGIGQRTCEMLAQEGARVVATDIQPVPLELAARIGDAGGLTATHDVAEPGHWVALIARVQRELGTIAGVVNNAGVVRVRNLEKLTLEEWRAENAINLDGVFLGTQAGIGAMKGHGGSIVNVASVAAMVGIHTAPAYCAAKGGVRSFTKAAAMYCAQLGYDIRVNSVHPGYIDTPMVEGLISGSRHPTAMREAMLSQPALGRLGEAEDVAGAILYLLGSPSRFVTGSELVVDGGYLAR